MAALSGFSDNSLMTPPRLYRRFTIHSPSTDLVAQAHEDLQVEQPPGQEGLSEKHVDTVAAKQLGPTLRVVNR